MPRQAGISALYTQGEAKRAMERKAAELAETQRKNLQDQLEIFKSNLHQFARKYAKEIRTDPRFRMQFQRMCQIAGVDPLVSSKGFWAELLGVGDFYCELGIQIVDICMSTRAINGGLIELKELKQRIDRRRGNTATLNSHGYKHRRSNSLAVVAVGNGLDKDKDKGKHSNEIIEDDIKRAIKQLQPLGGGYQVITLGSRKMVQSAPREMNKDQTNLLVLAQDNGYFTVRLVEEKYRWNHDRIQNSLDAMLRDGLVWLDDQIRPNQYWVPAYFFS